MRKMKYTNGEITVIWEPGLCNHNGYCYTNLESVFDPLERPWINMSGASTEEIIDTVDNCPTGALTYKRNSDVMEQSLKTERMDSVVITTVSNGPFIVKGDFVVIDKNGKELPKSDKLSLCRCGASKNQPYCDGTHAKINFKD